LPIVVALVEAGAAVNAVDECGRTAIFAAVMHPYASVDLVRWLIRAGSNLSTRATLTTFTRTPQITPLHAAIYANDAEVIKALLEAGADPHARDGEGNTPLIAAALRGKADAVALLLAAGGIDDARLADGSSILTSLVRKREQSGRDGSLDRIIEMLRNK
jgi:ankyrin repeat protein